MIFLPTSLLLLKRERECEKNKTSFYGCDKLHYKLHGYDMYIHYQREKERAVYAHVHCCPLCVCVVCGVVVCVMYIYIYIYCVCVCVYTCICMYTTIVIKYGIKLFIFSIFLFPNFYLNLLETQQTPASDNNDNNDNNDEVAPNDNTRQTRSRQQSTCLYKGCNNHTRADSYCSDVCARKDEQGTPAVRRNTKKKETPPPPPPPEESEKEEPQESSTPNSPSQMTADENPVRRNVIKNMTGILKTIMESAVQKDPELFNVGEIPERAESLARSIENTMLEQLGDTKGRQRTCGEPYKNKFRSLLHNLKDKANQTFQLRVVAGDLTPLELIKMSSEDMANPELRSMSEVLRQKSLKNSILKIENVPIIKKTHKGDIIMIPSKEEKNQDDFYKEPLLENKNSSSNQQEIPVSDTADHTSTKSAEPMDDILARIGVANQEDQRRDPSNLNAGHRAKKRKVTVDVETLLGEEEETPFVVEEVDTTELENQEESDQKDQTEEPEAMEQDEEEGEIPSIWQGKVNMPQVAEFEACARQVGGRQLNAEEWKEVLSPTMWIEGRIPSDRVTNYITQTQYSSSREIVLIQVEAQNRQAEPSLNEGQAQTLLNYLQTRQRYAVVGHNKTKIKDFYLIPLQKVQQIPDWLYVVRVEETKRDADLFLGVLVLQRTKQQQQQQQQPVSFHYPSY